jgi:Tol biopolymer transport system component
MLAGPRVVAQILPEGSEQTSPALGPASWQLCPSGVGRTWNSDVSVRGLTPDGRFALVQARASNVVPGDTNDKADVFRFEVPSADSFGLEPGAIQRVSLTQYGAQPNADCFAEALTADGRYVLFRSRATNMSGGTAPGIDCLYRADIQTGNVGFVAVLSMSVDAGESSSDCVAQLSDDGRYAAYVSDADLTPDDTNGLPDVYWNDLQKGTRECITAGLDGGPANGRSWLGGMSGDGQFVVFSSLASNLVPGDGNDHSDVFLYDRAARSVERISVSTGGAEGNDASDHATISRDGRSVLYWSQASNLEPSDANGRSDLFLHDRVRRTTELVGLKSGGGASHESDAPTDASIGPGGQYVLFTSATDDLVPNDANQSADLFIHDLNTRITQRIKTVGSPTADPSAFHYLSSDGATVVFSSLGDTEQPFVATLTPGTLNGQVVVTSFNPPATGIDFGCYREEYRDLGRITYEEFSETRQPGEALGYRFQAVRAGQLVIETIESVLAGQIGLELLGADHASLATSAWGGGMERLEFTIPGPGEYYLKVTGTNTSVHLRAANQVQYVGSRMNVFDTDEADEVRFAAWDGSVRANDIEYTPAPDISLVVIEGGSRDTLLICEDFRVTESLFANEDAAIFSGGPFTLRANHFGIVRAQGSPDDTATLHGSTRGGDMVSFLPNMANLFGGSSSVGVSGFGRISAFAHADGGHASFTPSDPGPDYFRFDATNLVAGMTDAAGTYACVATGYRSVWARASAESDDDIAILDGSPGDDVFKVTADYAAMSNPDASTYLVMVSDFTVVLANAREGNDTATLEAEPDGAGQNFIGATGFGLLASTSRVTRANGFDTLTVATLGNQATARLYDTPGDDTLDVRTGLVELQSEGHTTRLVDFGNVDVYSTTGNDQARFYDSDNDDQFIANPTIAALYAGAAVASAWNFPSVVAYRTSGKGNDVASLAGTAGDDMFDAYGSVAGIGSYATLAGTVRNRAYLIRVENFPTVSAISGGGQDTATLRGTAAVDAVLATPGLVQLRGSGVQHSASQFSRVNVETGGGADTASFTDSAAADRLDAAADWAQIHYGERTVRLSGLSELARIVAGLHADDEKHEEAHDFALTVLWLS